MDARSGDKSCRTSEHWRFVPSKQVVAESAVTSAERCLRLGGSLPTPIISFEPSRVHRSREAEVEVAVVIPRRSAMKFTSTIS